MTHFSDPHPLTRCPHCTGPVADDDGTCLDCDRVVLTERPILTPGTPVQTLYGKGTVVYARLNPDPGPRRAAAYSVSLTHRSVVPGYAGTIITAEHVTPRSCDRCGTTIMGTRFDDMADGSLLCFPCLEATAPKEA